MLLRSIGPGTFLYLFQNLDDDSRYVATGPSDKKQLEFSADLRVSIDGKTIGYMKSTTFNQSGTPAQYWLFEPVDTTRKPFNTLVLVNDYSWRDIEDAEVRITRHLLQC